MRTKHILHMVCIATLMAACTISGRPEQSAESVWKDYDTGTVIIENTVPDSLGWHIYSGIIPDIEGYVKEKAWTVLNTLYNSPEDSIGKLETIVYRFEYTDGMSAKSGADGHIIIHYSVRHAEKFFEEHGPDTTAFVNEIRGFLLHELTHGFQFEPQGIGTYHTNHVYEAFVEGVADAVRVANDGFEPNARPRGGNYLDGHRTTGYFFVWLRDNKDPEFIRKFNRSAVEVVPWSFDGAIKHVLGREYQIDSLWREYQYTVGDIQL